MMVYLVLFLSQLVWGGHADSLEHYKEVFETKAQAPKMESLTPGYYAGHCFTYMEPKIIKAGVLVVVPAKNGKVKIILPAGSLVEEANKWYDLSSEDTMLDISVNLFPESNEPAFLADNSLVSFLKYETFYPVGKLFLRQKGNHYLLKMTVVEYDNLETAKTWFYCHYDKKVKNW